MIRNDDIREIIEKKTTIIDTIKKRKLRLFRRICRMTDNGLINHTIFAKINGKPRKGCPCREWLDDIKDLCGRSGRNRLHLTQDLQMWKELIRTVVDPNGR